MTAILAFVVTVLATAGEGAGLTAGPPTVAQSGFTYTEGPLWLGEAGLIFSDIPGNTIYRLDKSVFRRPSGAANGLTLDLEGRVIVCETEGRRVTRLEKDGTVTVIADRFEGKRFNGPNDVVVRSDGTVFFTDPPYGLPKMLHDPAAELDFAGVFAVKSGEPPHALARDFVTPNGLAFSRDEKILYVSDTEAGHVRVFDAAADGTLSNSRELYRLPRPDGVKVDTTGNIWCAAENGVHAMNARGKRLQVVPVPKSSNCAFGDSDARTLYITAWTDIYRVRTAVPGLLPGPKRQPSGTETGGERK